MNKSFNNTAKLNTEQPNLNTRDIDLLNTEQILKKINYLDQQVPYKVAEVIPQIVLAVDLVVEHFQKGGRLVYIGAGTSGRLGYMDAAECPPTFGVSLDRVTCVMAGGRNAVFNASEGTEDSGTSAVEDLKAFGLTACDILMAVSASGRTPYCIAALEYAKSIGAGRLSLSCNTESLMSNYSQVAIEVDTGEEAIMGSTRMKAGTAQKLVMNMISTASMIKTGKVYSHFMVGTQALNRKLDNRITRIFMQATGNFKEDYAKKILMEAEGNLK